METAPAASQPVALVPVEQLAASHRYPFIFRVPFDQRKINPEAYTPKMVIIGPLHHAKKQEAKDITKEICTSTEMEITKHRFQQYLDMEDRKKIYFQSFCRRTSTEEENLRSYVKRNEKKIRRCYEDSNSIGSSEFVELILYDAIFIIEFMLRTIRQEYRQDDPLLKPTSLDCIHDDLILLENQLPLFVLEELSSEGNVCFPHYCTVFQNYPQDAGLMHFTDLLRHRKVRSLKSKITRSGDKVRRSYNVEKLQKSGVQFVVKEGEDGDSIDVSFEKKQLKLPKFRANDDTEKELRNVMALEQCCYEQEMHHVCNYVIFLDSLMDTAKDVGILVENGIIENHLGSDALLVDMVNKLSRGLVTGPSCYADVAKRLSEHRDKTWNRIMATATTLGFFILLLTITQAVTSILQVVQQDDVKA